jgi:ligand-binding sensor domain-containing protein/anti-sigma regulatory factor (Ser/Thr protein kinase)
MWSVVLALWSVSFFAQEYSFIAYSLKEGLGQSQVRALYQDSRGYIWAGTLGGVSRFDGRKFVNYDREQGLLNNQINCILELKNGSIALGSVGGISILNAIGIVSVKFNQQNAEAVVNAMHQEASGRVLLGTDMGLFIWENGNVIYAESVLKSANIKAFYTDEKQQLFVVTKEAIYQKVKNDYQEFYRPDNEGVSLFDAKCDGKGRLWMATKGMGLISRDKDGSVQVHSDSDMVSSTLTGVEIDSNGHVWSQSRFGFFEYDGTTMQQYTEREGLPTPEIRDILFDREGVCWLASYGSGILKFTGRTFSTFTTAQGLSSNAVMSITEEPNGKLWFATFDRGMSVLQSDTLLWALQSQITSNNRMWASTTTKDGAVWLGSSDGLYRVKDGKTELFDESDSLLNRMVLSLHESRNGRLYIGTAEGICYFESGKIHRLSQYSDFPKTRIRDIAEDASGKLWLASRDGIYTFNGTGFGIPDGQSSLLDKSSYSVEIDSQNRAWVGTQNGVVLYENGVFAGVKSLGDEPGANTINFLKVKGQLLWIGTLNGVYVLSISGKQTLSDMQAKHFGLDDGFRSLETNLNAVYVDSKDNLWIGTPEGVVRVDLRLVSVSKRSVAPKLILSAIHLNLKAPDWKGLGQTVDASTGLPIQLNVGHKNNHFTFYFDGISTTHPNQVLYQYMLEGFDEEWQALTAVPFATYSNLPFDAFTFKVRALSAEGVWSDSASYSFVIRSPFWLRWWFILLEFLAFAGIAWVVISSRLRVTRGKREREQLEMKSRMLTLEQQSLNSSMNRHFIFNALNSIQYYINRQDRLAANRYLSDFAKLIRKNLDSSQENLTPLREEIERLELYLKLEHMRFKDKFTYTISIDESLDTDQIKVPAMLIQPFLENSIWHGLLPKETQGHVLVSIERDGERLRFVIRDNGIGVDHSLKSKSDSDNHISKGMQITGNRIELIRKMTGQNIELQGPRQLNDSALQPLGTEVIITMPMIFNELFSY